VSKQTIILIQKMQSLSTALLNIAIYLLITLFITSIGLLIKIWLHEVYPDVPESLGDRMKYYESQHEHHITNSQKYAVRLDGKNFSTHMSKLKKPLDYVFSEAMLLTARDLLVEFKPQSVYVQSDEITAIFDKQEHMFGGRVEKILSVLSGFVSVRFTYNFKKCLVTSVTNCQDPETVERHKIILETIKMYGPKYTFDSRLMTYPEEKTREFLNNLYWRSCIDGFRNFVSMVARHHFNQKTLQNKSTKERVEMLASKNVILNKDYRAHVMYGWFIKNEVRDIVTDNGTGTRNFPVAKSFKINYSEDLLQTLFGKNWPQNDNMDIEILEVEDFSKLPIYK
jgi:tRNA(His) 5'-end guanylyltransferase